MSEWQPISTAPMTDGIEILLVNEDGDMSVGYFSMAGWSCLALGEVACRLPDQAPDWPEPIRMEPTHWMPLPSSPNPGAPA